MVQTAMAPCNPFATTNSLMRRCAELAEKLDVRLHTHLAESKDEEGFCLEHYGRRPMERFQDCGWGTGREWVAHAVCLNDESCSKWDGGSAVSPTARRRTFSLTSGSDRSIGCSNSTSPLAWCRRWRLRGPRLSR